ncbi:hypothetical protein F5884DRAFT_793350 [Xylogone sp. PMI_703]|nr:hypothetical protein F5884DRAFT_793350 [Xylogone sp. PMI_703]
MSGISPSSLDSASTSSTPPGSGAARFVAWRPEDAPTRKGLPRLYHKKSRNGCQRCRGRRVKCDEVHPVCGSCQRHRVNCVYGRPPPTRTSERLASSQQSGGHEDVHTEKTDHKDAYPEAVDFLDETPQARRRRLLELKLLYHFMTTAGSAVFIPSSSPVERNAREVWTTKAPLLAFQHDSLLYVMYSVAALHIANTEPQNIEMIEASSMYLGLSIQAHRDEIARLNQTNADAIILTSSLIRLSTVAMLQERDLQPYSPPIQWLSITNEAGSVFVAASRLTANDPTSLTRIILDNSSEVTGRGAIFKGTKPWEVEATFGASYRQGFTHLLERSNSDLVNEPWNAEIQEAYETTVNFIGNAHNSILSGKHSGDILRMLMLFPMLIQRRFIEFIEDEQPRAMVILAHYFALLAKFRSYWWVGEAGKKEIQGIWSMLPPEWRRFLEWPLKALEEEPFPAPESSRSESSGGGP